MSSVNIDEVKLHTAKTLIMHIKETAELVEDLLRGMDTKESLNLDFSMENSYGQIEITWYNSTESC